MKEGNMPKRKWTKEQRDQLRQKMLKLYANAKNNRNKLKSFALLTTGSLTIASSIAIPIIINDKNKANNKNKQLKKMFEELATIANNRLLQLNDIKLSLKYIFENLTTNSQQEIIKYLNDNFKHLDNDTKKLLIDFINSYFKQEQNINELKEKITSLEEKIKELNQQIADIENKISKINKEIKNLRNTIKRYRSRVSKLSGDVLNERNKNEKLNKTLDLAEELATQEINLQIKEKNLALDEIERLKKEIKKIKINLLAAYGEVESHQEVLKKLKNKYKTLKSLAYKYYKRWQTIKSLNQGNLDASTKKIYELTKDRDGLIKERNQLEKDKDTANKVILKERSAKNKKIKELKDKNKELKDKNKELKDKIKNEEEKFKSFLLSLITNTSDDETINNILGVQYNRKPLISPFEILKKLASFVNIKNIGPQDTHIIKWFINDHKLEEKDPILKQKFKAFYGDPKSLNPPAQLEAFKELIQYIKTW